MVAVTTVFKEIKSLVTFLPSTPRQQLSAQMCPYTEAVTWEPLRSPQFSRYKSGDVRIIASPVSDPGGREEGEGAERKGRGSGEVWEEVRGKGSGRKGRGSEEVWEEVRGKGAGRKGRVRRLLVRDRHDVCRPQRGRSVRLCSLGKRKSYAPNQEATTMTRQAKGRLANCT